MGFKREAQATKSGQGQFFNLALLSITVFAYIDFKKKNHLVHNDECISTFYNLTRNTNSKMKTSFKLSKRCDHFKELGSLDPTEVYDEDID